MTITEVTTSNHRKNTNLNLLIKDIVVDKELPAMMDDIDELSVTDLGRAQKRELKTLLGQKQIMDEDDPEEFG